MRNDEFFPYHLGSGVECVACWCRSREQRVARCQTETTQYARRTQSQLALIELLAHHHPEYKRPRRTTDSSRDDLDETDGLNAEFINLDDSARFDDNDPLPMGDRGNPI